MKYTVSVKIEKDRDTVVNLIQDPTYFKEWMAGLTSYNILEQPEGDIGTVTELNFQDSKGRVTKMVEKIESKNLPEEIVTSYEAGEVYNRCINRFYEIDGNTIYEMETVFKFGLLTNLYIWMFKGVFRQQTRSGMLSFKRFIEERD